MKIVMMKLRRDLFSGGQIQTLDLGIVSGMIYHCAKIAFKETVILSVCSLYFLLICCNLQL
jgi:hypothetical protein